MTNNTFMIFYLCEPPDSIPDAFRLPQNRGLECVPDNIWRDPLEHAACLYPMHHSKKLYSIDDQRTHFQQHFKKIGVSVWITVLGINSNAVWNNEMVSGVRLISKAVDAVGACARELCTENLGMEETGSAGHFDCRDSEWSFYPARLHCASAIDRN